MKQSSTGFGEVASRAVDGNSSGIYSNGSVTHTWNNVQAWWQVHLSSRINRGLIRIYNRAEVPQRLSDFYVFVSDSDMSGRSLSSLLSDPDEDHTFFTGQASALEEFSSIGSGCYVKVPLTGNVSLSLADVEVYETILP